MSELSGLPVRQRQEIIAAILTVALVGRIDNRIEPVDATKVVSAYADILDSLRSYRKT